MRRELLIALAVLLTGAALWSVIPASGSADINADSIVTGPVELARFEDYLPVRAEVAPAVTTLVGVMSGGQVEALLVEDGALVTQGQPLAQLANPELRLQVMTQEAQIASQLGGVASENLGIARSRADRQAQLSQAQYDLVQATREYDARRQLHERGFLSDAGIQRYVAEVEFQRGRVEELKQGLASESRFTAAQGAMLDQTRGRLQGTLGALRASLDALTIRAPRSGRLTNFTLQPGQTLAAGDPAGQIDSESEWKLVAEVDEFYLGRLRAGQTGQTAQGAKLVVAKVLPTVSNGRFRVELAFAGPAAARLNRGQTLDVRIQLGAATRAVVVPMGGWLSEGGNSVFVVDADGSQARRRTIEVGRRNPRQVEILSGLKPGEVIITSNLSQVEGDLLNIR
ncbi:efflux RND transporter periplasmic adaptor subunit [Erythrobacter donghaensis]|uniref:efflux RND transporter periplasmic adaptor subunit n=1 Tax=Erythrobacter donghaensis TaxID=267135 RepID=UPI001FE52D6C|nr:efflux RND transporter periplasmic adaptor subunit [Erythrobacter donghaensis]